MHFSGLCRSIFKDVLQTKKTEVFTYIWRNAPKSLCKTSIRNFHCSRIVLQKPPNPRPYFSKHRAGTARNYAVAFLLTALGGTYAAVPLYRLYCQSTGYAGTVSHDVGGNKMKQMEKIKDRKIKVIFNSDVNSSLDWDFRPQQHEIEVYPGETALAFFTATNPTDRPITGVSTYNVVPFEAAAYFNKIQCFCFEEQRLNPKEQVDMPVFFYIDPDFMNDARMLLVDEIILSYTFFEAKPGMAIPVPAYVKRHNTP